MSAYDARVKHDPFEVGFLKSLENGLPSAFFGPSGEAFVDSVVFAVSLRQVLPGCAGASDPEHGIDEVAVVVSVSSRISGFAGEQGFDPGVVVVRDVVAVHGLDGRWREKPSNCRSSRRMPLL